MNSKNSNLRKAKTNKNDEFYTQLTDVSEELRHYKKHFKGKTVFCNCDDPTWSAFWKYFHLNFEVLGLKKLISTHYDKDEPTYKMVYEGGDDNNIEVGEKTPLQGNGDFRNQECVELLKESDIVVTNPPFSLFREYIAQLMEYGKKFLIIGNLNAITYREVFPLIKENKVWMGYTYFKGGAAYFVAPAELYDPNKMYNPKNAYLDDDGKFYWRVNGVRWYTNLDHNKRHEKIVLWKTYTPEEYPTYDNYEAINVNKTVEIPSDYDGVMGVPISFLDKYNPNQFEIIGGFNGYKECDYENSLLCGSITEYIDKNGKIKKWTGPTVNKKSLYYRILIRKK